MADGINFKRVADIVNGDSSRRYVVVSAPGKRFGGDAKITDLLYETARDVENTGRTGEAYEKVKNRFVSIVRELNLAFDIEALIEETRVQIIRKTAPISRRRAGNILRGASWRRFWILPFSTRAT